MNTTGCCSSCTSTKAESIFTMGSYVPERVGYPQTYSFPTFSAYPSASRPTGITPLGVAGECLGQPVPRPCNYETATLGGYNRGGGNPDPMYSVGGYSNTGNPNIWSPMSGYSNTGNPNIWSPMSGYSNTGNPNIWNPFGSYAGSGTGYFNRMGSYEGTGTGYPNRMGSFSSSDNGANMVQRIGDGAETLGGVQPVGFLWPLIGAGLGLAAIAGATYVAKGGVDNITTNPDVATSLSQPVVQTTTNIATTVGLGLLAYVIFRKDIQKLLK